MGRAASRKPHAPSRLYRTVQQIEETNNLFCDTQGNDPVIVLKGRSKSTEGLHQTVGGEKERDRGDVFFFFFRARVVAAHSRVNPLRIPPLAMFPSALFLSCLSTDLLLAVVNHQYVALQK